MRHEKTNPHVFALDGEIQGPAGLRAVRCGSCGKHTQGRVAVCAHCFSQDVTPVSAGRSGVLIEFSIARVAAGGFEAPYAIGQIRTDDEMTLFAPLIGDPEGFIPGTRVRFALVEHPTGKIGFGYVPEGSEVAS